MNNMTREILEGAHWRILQKDAAPADKFRADMELICIGEFSEGDQFARGLIWNDSRGIFFDGEVVRTSVIKDIYEVDGETFIETRNTLYRVIGDVNDWS